jgi:hypothetical protein
MGTYKEARRSVSEIIGSFGGKDQKMLTRITTYLTGLAMLLAASLLISPSLYAASVGTADSPAVAQLFSEARSHAVALKADAEVMETFTRNKTHWRTQSDQINQIKLHTNDLAKVIQQLNDARDTAAPWQQQAIDRLNPMLKDLVVSVESMIHCVSDQTSSPLGAGTYKECIRNNHKVCVDLEAVITDYVDYGTNKTTSEELGKTLNVSAHQ